MIRTTFPFGVAVTAVARTVSGQDSEGNDDYSESRTTLHGVAVWPLESSETADGTQDQVITRKAMILPSGQDASAYDWFEIDGDTYKVDGDPLPYVHPFTPSRVTQVNLKKVT